MKVDSLSPRPKFTRASMRLEVARPSWLPPPPCGHETSNHRGNGSHRVGHRPPRFTLCSVAIGEPYESRLEQLRFSAAAAGFDRTLLWKRSDVLADPLFQQSNISAAFDVMDAFFRRYHHKKGTGHWSARPYCAAFKPVIMWRALHSSAPGDYVLWADASQYARNITLLGGLQQAVALLTGRVPRPPPPNVTGRRGGRARRGSERTHGMGGTTWQCAVSMGSSRALRGTVGRTCTRGMDRTTRSSRKRCSSMPTLSAVAATRCFSGHSS